MAPNMRDFITTVTEVARPPTRVGADAVLRNAGYERLGRGVFGAVYQKPGQSFVLKVFQSSDVAYIRFVKLAQAHQDNPHFPRFIGKLIRVVPAYFAIRMERLTPFIGEWRLISDYMCFSYRKFDYDCPLKDRVGKAVEFMEENPDLRAACDLIMNGIPHDIDMNEGKNLMMRGSTIVITDPVSTPGADSVLLPPAPSDD